MDNNCSAVILGSGLSERMGKPKALLHWDESTTFLEKIINEYNKADCSEIICMINIKTKDFCNTLNLPSNIKFVMNLHPEWGRFYSIKTAVQALKEIDYCFIQNVDNPFVSIDLIEKIYSERNSYAWCSPMYNEKGGHPILIPKYIFNKIPEVKINDMSLLDFLIPFQRIIIETDDDTILKNINTPEDYTLFLKSKS